MYDIRQFKASLYLLILIGMTGFAMSSQSPGLWVVAITLVLVNAWMVHIGQFRPLPRLAANLVTLLSFFYLMLQLGGRGGSPILAIGQFLVLLQVVKLWEQRANRDYAQLLVLSLLLMVSAAISTASLIFGIMLVFYLFLSLYCCLLFHLKAETDEAKAAMAVPVDRVNPNTLKQDQRHLPSSMRRLTGLVSVFAITSAIIVFLLFPRGSGAGMFGQFQWKPGDTLTGFKDQVSFQQVAKITQNNDEVATVEVWKDGKPVSGTETLWLRGLTHEVYNGDDEERGQYQWGRTAASRLDEHQDVEAQTEWHPRDALTSAHYLQKIKLSPTGTSVIFAMAGPVSINPQLTPTSPRRFNLSYSPADEVLQSTDPIQQPIIYSVASTGSLGNETPSIESTQQKSKIDPLITQYARRSDVTGVDLVARREALAANLPPGIPQTTVVDEQIARNIEKHLRTTFSYTLDLTDAHRIQGQDPVVAFLYDLKRGHCEYFAGAMTLLCQSLGMQARMVVGFKCDDYNNFGHYYSVKQSHAHAWVEVYTTDGWKTFDPTSGRDAGGANTSTWEKTKHLFNFLEYTWANAVIAYDSNNRENLIQRFDNRLTNTAISSSTSLLHARDIFDTVGGWLATRIVGPLIIILSVGLIGFIGWFFYERMKMRRRASRIGIEFLPATAQLRLVRQLGFYDDLLLLLERNQIVRPKHLTPMEFSDSLSFLPTKVYSTVQRLTNLFYRIRYGQAELDLGQRRRLSTVIDRLSATMLKEKNIAN